MKIHIIILNALVALGVMFVSTNYAIADHYKRKRVFKRHNGPVVVKKRIFKHKPNRYHKRNKRIVVRPFANTRIKIKPFPRVRHKIIHVDSSRRYAYSMTKNDICNSLTWSYQRRKCRNIVFDKFYTHSELSRCSLKSNDRKTLKCMRRNGFFY